MYEMNTICIIDNMYERMFKTSDKQKPVYVDVPHEILLTEDSFPTSFHSQLPKSLPSLKGKYMGISIKSNNIPKNNKFALKFLI